MSNADSDDGDADDEGDNGDDGDNEDDEDADVVCIHCQLGDSLPGNDIVLCDSPDCADGWHLRCLRPRLAAVPVGRWKCPRCTRRHREQAHRFIDNEAEHGGSGSQGGSEDEEGFGASDISGLIDNEHEESDYSSTSRVHIPLAARR